MKFIKVLLVFSLLLNLGFICNYAFEYHISNKKIEVEDKVREHIRTTYKKDFHTQSNYNFKMQGDMKSTVFVNLYDDPKVYEFYINDGTVELLGVTDIDGVGKTLEEVNDSSFDEYGKYIK